MRKDLIPYRDCLTDKPIYQLGECRAGLVYWNIEQANSVGRQEFSSAWNGDVFLLPANATQP